MGPTGCPQKLVTKYPSTLSNTPEEWGFYLHCGGILKSGIEVYVAQMMFMSYYCPGKSEGIPVVVVPKCGCELFLVRTPVICMVNSFTLRERHFSALRQIFFVCSLSALAISIQIFWVSSTSLRHFIFKRTFVLFLALCFTVEKSPIAMFPFSNLL